MSQPRPLQYEDRVTLRHFPIQSQDVHAQSHAELEQEIRRVQQTYLERAYRAGDAIFGAVAVFSHSRAFGHGTHWSANVVLAGAELPGGIVSPPAVFMRLDSGAAQTGYLLSNCVLPGEDEATAMQRDVAAELDRDMLWEERLYNVHYEIHRVMRRVASLPGAARDQRG